MQRNSHDDIEKLLAIAERQPKAKVKDTKKRDAVEEYIKKNNIKEGRTRVSAGIIYYHYWVWKKTNRLTRISFFKEFSHMFKKNRSKNEVAYLLNSEPFDLSSETYFKARVLLRRERDVRQKEKAKK